VPCMAYAVEIEPMRLELEVNRSDKHSGSLEVTNHTDETIEISASTGKYRFIESANAIYPTTLSQKNLQSCQNWIKLDPDRAKIKPDSTLKLSYEISVPENSFGEYVAAIVVDEEKGPRGSFDSKTPGVLQVKITPRYSIPVYVSIKDYFERSAEIEEFKAEADAKNGAVSFEITLKNTGTTHLRPSGTVVVMGEGGYVATRLATGKCLPVFSGFGEKIPVRWIRAPKGKYTAVATIDIGTEELLQETIEFEVE